MNVAEVSVGNIPVLGFYSMPQAVDYIESYFIAKKQPGIAVAVNPEKVISCIDSDSVNAVVMGANFRYMDGIGVVRVANRKADKKFVRIPGCDLWLELMKKAALNNYRVAIVGATDEVNRATNFKLTSQLGVNVVLSCNGYFEDEQLLIEQLKSSKPDIVAVALGSPKQEVFMKHCIDEGILAFFMGVGGTFDVFTGNVTRAPAIFCRLGLEWLYRLIRQPSRILRQTKLVTFLFLSWQGKL